MPCLWGAYQNSGEFYFKYLCTGENSPTITLWTLTEAAFQCDCFACHVLKVRCSKLYANTADFCFGVCIVTHKRHLNICLECVRICLLELFKMWCPCKRTNDVYIYTVFAPFCCRNTGKATNTLFCISCCDAVTDRAAFTVLKNSTACACDNNGFTCKISHCNILIME